MKIVRTFKDGTVLVESNEGSAIMDLNEYERLKLRKFDLSTEIINRLKQAIPHCTFSIKEIKSREHIFMDDDTDLTNISISSIEFWMRDQEMSYDDITTYLDNKIMPSILLEANKIEHQRCAADMMYFFMHYIRNKGVKD